MPDEGITGPNHQKYLDQLVFDNKFISRADMNKQPDNFKTKFKAGEPIYTRAFLSKALYNYEVKGLPHNGDAQSAYYYAMVEIDGGKPFCILSQAKVAKAENGKLLTSCQLDILPEPEKVKSAHTSFIKAVNALTPGDHQVKVTCWPGQYMIWYASTPAATGTFTLTVPAGGAKIPLPKGESFASVPAGMDDPALAAQLLQVAQKKATNEKWPHSFTKLKIKSEAWELERNELTGRVLSRSIEAWGLADWHDGKCTYISLKYKEEYDGSNYSAPLLEGEGMSNACECK